jgi:mRNA interferase MazF
MLKAGDVVTVDFPAAGGIKRRPAVVLSSETYHRQRPDVILGILTSNVAMASAASDFAIQDWQAAGLRVPSAFRTYLGMAVSTAVRRVGRLSTRDWQGVKECLRQALG